jgi:hypothetical protein
MSNSNLLIVHAPILYPFYPNSLLSKTLKHIKHPFLYWKFNAAALFLKAEAILPALKEGVSPGVSPL